MKNLIILIVLMAAGCQEVQQQKYKPLNQLIAPARQDWKDAYGDTLETQMVFNLAVLRLNDVEIAKMINSLRPPVDPNETR